MAQINLRDYCPFYEVDILVDIPDEVADVLMEVERQEEACRRRMYRHKTQYFLDRTGLNMRFVLYHYPPARYTNTKSHRAKG